MKKGNNKTTIVNFSGRSSDGNGEKLSKFVNGLLEGKAGLINFSSLNVSGCNRCDYECLRRDSCKYINDDVKKLYDILLKSDCIIFIIPVYCNYPCSNYFVFHERAQCCFNEENYDKYVSKPIKFIIIANSGYENVMGVLRDDFKKIAEEDVVVLGSRKYGTKSVNGDLIEYDEVKQEIRRLLDGIIK